MRPRFPRWLLIALFVLVPIVEIYVIVTIGQAIGAGWTVLLLVASAIVGAWLVKHEGRRAWQALNQALVTGRMPARELADGALILIGGTLMLAPGFVTDVFGLLFVLPFTRPVVRRVLTRLVGPRLAVSGPMRPGGPAGQGDVVEGTVVEGTVVDQ